ncbi:MAG: hypothetical protein WCS42_14580 [Verrucomicrobiota bacterium]
MNHPLLYFGGVLLVLLAFAIGLVLVARTAKYKPKPIKPVWAVLIIVGAVFIAGSVCSIAGKDIHILYWWLAGLPIVAAGIPMCCFLTNFLVRLILVLFGRVLSVFGKK